jgi:PEP-CTERM motif
MDRKFLSTAAFVLGGFALAGSASAALTLNTAGLKANSTLQLSTAAQTLSAQSGLTFRAGGNAYAGPAAGSFVLPVTEAVLNVGLFKPTTPVSGKSIGSALIITKGTGNTAKTAGLANFSVDFATKQITGDLISGGAAKSMALFAFKEQTPLKINLKGLSLTMNQTLGNLTLKSGANTALGSALGLSSAAQAAFGNTNFGTVTIDITTVSRKAISTKAFTPANMVPEPSTYALMALGLVGIGFAARRKARA